MMPEPTDKKQSTMSADEIRAQCAAAIRERYIEVLARRDAGRPGDWDFLRWEDFPESVREECRRRYEPMVDAVAAAGLLPIHADTRWVYEPDGTPLGYREMQFLTEWREASAPCRACGRAERLCGVVADRSQCCSDCRHPLWEVPE